MFHIIGVIVVCYLLIYVVCPVIMAILSIFT